jgi:hypothetical protein
VEWRVSAEASANRVSRCVAAPAVLSVREGV